MYCSMNLAVLLTYMFLPGRFLIIIKKTYIVTVNIFLLDWMVLGQDSNLLHSPLLSNNGTRHATINITSYVPLSSV